MRIILVLCLLWSSAWGTSVAPGVEYTVYNLPHPNVAHVLKIDLSRPEYKLKMGFPQAKRNYSTREVVSTIASRYDNPPSHDVIGAVDGSFYDTGITIHGVAFHKMQSERRAFEGLELADTPSIVIAHASYEAFEGQIERYHPFSAAEIPQAAYVALGHYHRFNPIGTGCYPGTPEGISFDAPETEDRFVVVGEVGGGQEQVKVNARIMRSSEVDCTSFDSQASLLDAVRKLCEPNALLQVKFTGSPNSEVAKALDGLADRFKESCLYLSPDLTGLSLPMDLPEGDLTIRGRFCKYMLQQIETADSDRARLLRRALEIGLGEFS